MPCHSVDAWGQGGIEIPTHYDWRQHPSDCDPVRYKVTVNCRKNVMNIVMLVFAVWKV